jgi:hypothetical protein
MHVGFKVQVEWGTCGLKRKWRRFMKKFDEFNKTKIFTFFQTTIVLTNFLLTRHIDFMFDVIRDQNFEPINHG